ncbi:hypothetical protein C3L33_23495, partial [Rhododendron williamsianum]
MVEEEAVGDIRGAAASGEVEKSGRGVGVEERTDRRVLRFAWAYEANLNNLLSVLSSNANTSTGFFNFTAGSSPPDVAYGLFLCREDVSVAVCRECIVSTSKDAVEKFPWSKWVTIWHEKCMLRYSNKSTFSSPAGPYWGL